MPVPPPAGGAVAIGASHTRVADSSAVLAEELEREKAERRTERFFWIFVAIGLANALVWGHIPTLGCLVFLIFSIILLLGLGAWLKVPWVVLYLERWLTKLVGGGGLPKE